MKQWMKDPVINKEKIEVMAFALADTGQPQALDALQRQFDGQEVASKYFRILLATKLDSPWFNHFSLLYRAIDSKDATIKALAQEVIPKLLQFPPEHRLSNWAEAMVERYDHSPTSVDILTDPLLELVRVHSPVIVEDVRLKLAKYSKEAFEKRRLEKKATKQ